MFTQPVEQHCKVVLIGDSNVGKTQLIRRLTKDNFSVEQGSTRGIEVTSKTLQVNGKEVHVQVWDTCGQEQYRCVSAPYYRGALGALAVFDLTRHESLNNLGSWLAEVRNKAADGVKILLVGAKDDLENEREVSSTEAKDYAVSEGLEYIETSALTGHNVSLAFTILIKKVVAKAVLGVSGTSVSLRSVHERRTKDCKC